jgi:hypothetical protein
MLLENFGIADLINGKARTDGPMVAISTTLEDSKTNGMVK